MRSQQGEEPTRWFRMERTTGQYETMPIPDTDHLCGVWNNQLVLFRERCSEPFASDKISDYSLAGSYSSRFQNTSYDVVLYDPVTAQSRRLYSLNENSGSFTHAALYGDSLYLDTTLWEDPDDTPFNAIRLNLRNGEQTALESLKGMILVHKVLQASNPVKRWVVLTGMKVLGKYDGMHGLVANPQPNPQCTESNRKLDALYARALPLAERLILEYVAKLDTDEPLDAAYDHTFGEF